MQWTTHIRFLLLWLAAGLCEGGFFWFLDAEAVLALALHGAALLLLIFSVPFVSPWRPVFLLFTGLFPVLGWLGSAVLYASAIFFPPKPPIGEEALWWEGPSIKPILSRPLARREQVARELDFLPLADVLAGQDVDLKRGAVEKLAQFKTPEAIQVLLAHRGDPSIEVRFYVTTALTRIKRELDEELDAAKKQMKKDVYKISGRIFLAKVYLQYSRSGLLDPVTANAYELEAQYHLDFSLQSEFASVEAFQLLIGIYLGRKNWERALQVVKLLEGRAKASPEDLAKIRIDILYRSGRYEEIPKTLAEQAVIFSDPHWQAMAHWWRGT